MDSRTVLGWGLSRDLCEDFHILVARPGVLLFHQVDVRAKIMTIIWTGNKLIHTLYKTHMYLYLERTIN